MDADDRIGFIMEKGFKLTKGFTMNGVITYFSGTRASTYKEDFIIEPSRKVENFIHVAGMQSPAVASAPAVADMVEDIFVAMHPGLREKADYNPYRTPPKEFRHCTPEEREALIREDPLFGHVVCRCETVTEAEIVQAMQQVRAHHGRGQAAHPGRDGALSGRVLLPARHRYHGAGVEHLPAGGHQERAGVRNAVRALPCSRGGAPDETDKDGRGGDRGRAGRAAAWKPGAWARRRLIERDHELGHTPAVHTTGSGCCATEEAVRLPVRAALHRRR